MHPQFDKPTNLNLPPPMVETPSAPAREAAPEALPAAPEIAPAPAERPPASQTAPAVTPLPVPPLADPVQQSNLPVNDAPVTTVSGAPAVADDGDLIEKEWVVKAKQIVDRNREDPHEQTKELSTFKADYMQKRYNKTIKLSE